MQSAKKKKLSKPAIKVAALDSVPLQTVTASRRQTKRSALVVRTRVVTDKSVLARCCRTVLRTRSKPLGRYEQWTDDYFTREREVVEVIESANNNAFPSLFHKGALFVVDLNGAVDGQLYQYVSHTDKRVLTQADCVADITNVNYSPTQKIHNIHVRPHRTTANNTRRNSVRAPNDSNESHVLLGSWFKLFLADGTLVTGKVSWQCEAFVEVLTKDTVLAKEWLRVPRVHLTKAKTPRATDSPIVCYALSRTHTDQTHWTVSSKEWTHALHRIQFVHQGQHRQKERLLHMLAQFAPHRISHLVPLCVNNNTSTTNTDEDSPSPTLYHVVVEDDEAKDDSVRLKIIHSTNTSTRQAPTVSTFPFSVTEQLDVALQPGHKKSITVCVALQAHPQHYVSLLSTRAMSSSLTASQYTLLPTTQELHTAYYFSASQTADQLDYVRVELSCTESSHLSACLQFCKTAKTMSQRYSYVYPYIQHTIQFVDIRESAFYAKPTDSVTIRVHRADVNEIVRWLSGQVHVSVHNDHVPMTNHTNTLYDACNTHWGQMCQQFVYHNVDHSVVLSLPPHMTALVSQHETPAWSPLPLRHNVKQNKNGQTQMLLQKEYYHPHHLHATNAQDVGFETLQQALPRVDKKLHISHKTLSKKLSSSRAVYDIEQMFEPSWFNVLAEDTAYESVVPLRQHFCTMSTSPSSFVLHNVSTIPCDRDAHTHTLYYEKVPSTTQQHVSPLRTHSLTHTNHPATKNTTFADEFFGYSTQQNATASQLSQLLFGSLPRFYNSIDTAYQAKSCLERRIVSGYGYTDLHLFGVLSKPRFDTSPIRITRMDQFWCVFNAGKTTINLKTPLSRIAKHITFPLTVGAYCRLLTKLLRMVNQSSIQVTYCVASNRVTMASQTPFTLTEPAGLRLLGATSPMVAQWEDLRQQFLLSLTECTVLTRSSGPSKRSNHSPDYKVNIKYVVKTDAPDAPRHAQRTARTAIDFTIRHSDESNVPVESADKHKMSTRVGRDGHTDYLSCSIHHTALLVSYDDATQMSTVLYPSGAMRLLSPHQANHHTYSTFQHEDHMCTRGCVVYTKTNTLSFVVTETHKTPHDSPSVLNHYLATPSAQTVSWSLSTLPTYVHDYLARQEHTPLQSACVDGTDGTQPVVYSARVLQNSRSGHWMCSVVRVGDTASVEHWKDTECGFLVQPLVCQLQMTERSQQLVMHILDVTNTLHSLVWKRESSGVHQQWTSSPSYARCEVLAQHKHRHALCYASALFVSFRRVCVASANAQLHVFERQTHRTRVVCVPTLSWNVASRLTNVPLLWRWTRNRKHPRRALVVELHHSEPVENIQIQDCQRSHLATRVITSLQRWMANLHLQTLTISYYADQHSLHNDLDLYRYMLQNVVGQKPTCTPSLSRALENHVLHNTNNVKVLLHRYIHSCVGSSQTYQTLSTTTVKQLQEVHERCRELADAPLNAIVPATEAHKRKSRTSSLTSSRTSRTTTQAKRELFYFKMRRLLATTSGIEYVRTMYATTNVFRHQFHKCRGYCYYKLLCKLKRLFVNGRRTVATKWTESLRDRHTTVMDGDVWHVCNRCGESVCKQDDGLRMEFGEIGQSATHHETDTRDASNDISTQITTNTQAHKRTLSLTLEYIDGVQLSAYQQHIFELPVTDTVRKYAKTQCNSLFQLALDVNVAPTKRSKLLALACEAVQLKLNELKNVRTLVSFQRKPLEEKIIREWTQAMRLTVKDIQWGIAPRKDFRPILHTQPASQSHTNWKQLHSELNNRSNTWHNIFDWTSKQNSSSFYEHNDVYICVNPTVVDAEQYTTLPRMLHGTLRAHTESHIVPHKRYPFTKWKTQPRPNTQSLKENCLPITTFHYNNGHPTPLFRNTISREHNDCQRRSSIVSCTHASTHTDMAFPYIIQSLLEKGILAKHAYVEQLLCLLGISTKQKMRLSTNPSCLLQTEWIKYYQQLETDQPNDTVLLQLKQIKKGLSVAFFKDPQACSYNKFIR